MTPVCAVYQEPPPPHHHLVTIATTMPESSSAPCLTCEELVTNKHKTAVCCVDCKRWVHAACGGIPVTVQNRPLLKHKNLPFLCDECMEVSLIFWANRRNKPASTNTSTQTDPDPECRSKETQTICAPELTEIKEVSLLREDKGTQSDETPSQRPKPKVVKAVKKQVPLRIIGDSMVKNVHKHVRCTMKGSGITSLRGAKVEKIKEEVMKSPKDQSDGELLIIQGGGNDLERKGTEDTVRELVDAVKSAGKKNTSIAVVGIMKRPREGDSYEATRKKTNERLSEELRNLKIEWMRGKKGSVSYIDLDGELTTDQDYQGDGVHLNDRGNERMARRLLEWVRARSLQLVGSLGAARE